MLAELGTVLSSRRRTGQGSEGLAVVRSQPEWQGTRERDKCQYNSERRVDGWEKEKEAEERQYQEALAALKGRESRLLTKTAELQLSSTGVHWDRRGREETTADLDTHPSGTKEDGELRGGDGSERTCISQPVHGLLQNRVITASASQSMVFSE